MTTLHTIYGLGFEELVGKGPDLPPPNSNETVLGAKAGPVEEWLGANAVQRCLGAARSDNETLAGSDSLREGSGVL